MRITSAGNLQVSNGKVQLTSQPTTQLEMFTNQLTLTAGGNQVFTGSNGAQDTVTIGRNVGDTDIRLAGGSGTKNLRFWKVLLVQCWYWY